MQLDGLSVLLGVVISVVAYFGKRVLEQRSKQEALDRDAKRLEVVNQAISAIEKMTAANVAMPLALETVDIIDPDPAATAFNHSVEMGRMSRILLQNVFADTMFIDSIAAAYPGKYDHLRDVCNRRLIALYEHYKPWLDCGEDVPFVPILHAYMAALSSNNPTDYEGFIELLLAEQPNIFDGLEFAEVKKSMTAQIESAP
jgi:hypothetical protein